MRRVRAGTRRVTTRPRAAKGVAARARTAGRQLALAAVFAAVPALPAAAQQGSVVAVEAQFRGFAFEEALGTEAAQLFIVPVAYRHVFNDRLRADLYAAWARGEVEREGTTHRLQGPVDTRVKLSWQATPWAVLSTTVNVPTGRERHDADEAVVAAVLATDLLAFRESTWGGGLAVTTGIATARRAGSWGLGVGASYRLAQGFTPSAGRDVEYEPGNEVRLRVGADRNVGETGKLNAGVTFQNFASDEADGRNLFQAGNRVMVDAAYAFRAGAQTWTLYAADLWRENGDLFLDLVDADDVLVGDSVIATPSQNLLTVGATGSIPVGAMHRVRPHADVRVQSREGDEGSGWLVGVGGDVPLRAFGAYDLFPRARLFFGSVTGPDLEGRSVTGASLGLTVRWTRR